jgi:sulfite oxidase
MIIHQQHPLNAGPTLDVLQQSITTPQEYFFIRSHGTVPDIDPADYRLTVTGLISTPVDLSLDDLHHKFPIAEVSATLQCAGMRRDELLTIAPIEDELPWGAEAISNAIWRGVPLRAVLEAVGVDSRAEHVEFCGLDSVQKDGEEIGFGASIPIAKALSEEVLLAYEMNGEPLTPEHGFPLRVIVPGYIGARSVKWLDTIKLQRSPSTNYFQSRAYKLFPPHIQASTADWEHASALTDLPLNSVICQPRPDEVLPAGPTIMRGYALTSAGHSIQQVELSCDGGTNWSPATIVERQSPWSWCFWESTVHLHPGPHQLVVRAVDCSASSQPVDLAQQWNFKGYLNHAWHRVHIQVYSNDTNVHRQE